ncbi:hypothetical protein [Archaeoglobus sp.]
MTTCRRKKPKCAVCGKKIKRLRGDYFIEGNYYCKDCFEKMSEKELRQKLQRYKFQIRELHYNKGYSVSRICLELGFGRLTSRHFLEPIPLVNRIIAFDILGYTDWAEYNREHAKISNRLRNKLRYKSGFNQKLKRTIKERDDYKCVICGKNKDLHIHHLDWDPTNNSVDNLITLCSDCHKFVHRFKITPPAHYSLDSKINYLRRSVYYLKKQIELLKSSYFPEWEV